jgi:hypothetical protein
MEYFCEHKYCHMTTADVKDKWMQILPIYGITVDTNEK